MQKGLKVIMLSVIMTLFQIMVFHIAFTIDKLDNVVKHVFRYYIKKIDLPYDIYIAFLTKIFGDSYTTVLKDFFEKFFMVIFVANMIFFAFYIYWDDISKLIGLRKNEKKSDLKSGKNDK